MKSFKPSLLPLAAASFLAMGALLACGDSSTSSGPADPGLSSANGSGDPGFSSAGGDPYNPGDPGTGGTSSAIGTSSAAGGGVSYEQGDVPPKAD